MTSGYGDIGVSGHRIIGSSGHLENQRLTGRRWLHREGVMIMGRSRSTAAEQVPHLAKTTFRMSPAAKRARFGMGAFFGGLVLLQKKVFHRMSDKGGEMAQGLRENGPVKPSGDRVIGRSGDLYPSRPKSGRPGTPGDLHPSRPKAGRPGTPGDLHPSRPKSGRPGPRVISTPADQNRVVRGPRGDLNSLVSPGSARQYKDLATASVAFFFVAIRSIGGTAGRLC